MTSTGSVLSSLFSQCKVSKFRLLFCSLSQSCFVSEAVLRRKGAWTLFFSCSRFPLKPAQMPSKHNPQISLTAGIKEPARCQTPTRSASMRVRLSRRGVPASATPTTGVSKGNKEQRSPEGSCRHPPQSPATSRWPGHNQSRFPFQQIQTSKL